MTFRLRTVKGAMKKLPSRVVSVRAHASLNDIPNRLLKGVQGGGARNAASDVYAASFPGPLCSTGELRERLYTSRDHRDSFFLREAMERTETRQRQRRKPSSWSTIISDHKIPA